MRKEFMITAVIIFVGLAIGTIMWKDKNKIALISPEGKKIADFLTNGKPEDKKEKPLNKYTIDNLKHGNYGSGQVVLDDIAEMHPAERYNLGYTVYKFHYTSQGKRVNGLAHIPNGTKKYPVIVQVRGWQDPANYQTGGGTKHTAEVFAKNGFITLAPDFLGYGGSDNPANDVFEARFETYTTILDLLAIAETVPQADSGKIGIWGHSNGGQIALTVLEISGKPYPTALWAPVSKPFPYSILFYTDDGPDHGKELRKKLAEFEENYDAELYSLPNYLDRITAPIQLHQGSADDQVPQKWSDELAANLKKNKVSVQYFVYPGADHNMLPRSWDLAVGRDVDFFNKNL